MEGILQELFDIISGARLYLPDIKITIGIAIALALIIYFKGPVGALLTSILVTILIAKSYFAESDLYTVSMDKAVAGIILGLSAFLINLYFLVRSLADWRD
jgi:Mn2+/Fe2+ NRAMP family transporter